MNNISRKIKGFDNIGGEEMELKGVHHITAITSSAEKIYDFFTYTLGMRLVKKTVNRNMKDLSRV